MATELEALTTAFSTLEADVTAKEAEGLLEIEKLEKELAEKGVVVNLAPLKEKVTGFDAKVKSAKVPTA